MEIRHKLAAIAVLFILSYMVLRLVHPAFHLSQTPIIILIGFFMLVASILTVWYLLGKFGIVMESVRQKVDMIHRADVARASATMAAFVLGISNMRKRKVRTGLTAVTLILLTFTILSFTSFETMPARMLEYASSRPAPYVGVLLRGLGWGSLSEFVTYDMADFFSVQGMRAAPRSWFVNRKPTEELQIEITRDDAPGTEAVANAVLGLAPEEKYFSGINSDQYYEGEWFDPQDGGLALRLHRALADEAEPADRGQGHRQGRTSPSWAASCAWWARSRATNSSSSRTWTGRRSRPLTSWRSSTSRPAARPRRPAQGLALSATGQLDVDTFVHQKSAKQEEEEQYIHMEPDRVLFVPNELNLKLGGQVRSIAAGPGVATAGGEGAAPVRGHAEGAAQPRGPGPLRRLQPDAGRQGARAPRGHAQPPERGRRGRPAGAHPDRRADRLQHHARGRLRADVRDQDLRLRRPGADAHRGAVLCGEQRVRRDGRDAGLPDRADRQPRADDGARADGGHDAELLQHQRRLVGAAGGGGGAGVHGLPGPHGGQAERAGRDAQDGHPQARRPTCGRSGSPSPSAPRRRWA